MSKLLIATHNAGKLKEFTAFFQDTRFELVSLADLDIHEDVEETGSTYAENASLKATTYARLSSLPTLADDSGLEVDGLDGEPGIRSARYAGDDANDDDRVTYLLQKLNDIPKERWTAQFRCVIAVAWQGFPVKLYDGECQGVITDRPRGAAGFGYDPVFYLPELGKTMAELPFDEKNRISHRGRAAMKAVEELRRRNWHE
jgi:XTP/dITP diphosphohydrolase